MRKCFGPSTPCALVRKGGTSETVRVLSTAETTDRELQSPAQARSGFPYLTAAALLIAWAILLRHLAPFWSANPQYSYGWFVPALALLLLYKRWNTRPPVSRAPAPLAPLLSAGLLTVILLPLTFVEAANPDWRLISWLLAFDVIGLSLIAAAVMGGTSWLRHFAFPLLFVMVAVPWPSGPEQAFVQSLMQKVAGLAVALLNILGEPAARVGNLIEVRAGVIGVDEACSGVRSFQSTLMAALFLGEMYRFPAAKRVALILGGVALAFAGNVLRAFFLAWMAAKDGLGAIGKWHDPAGLTVFFACFALLWVAAALLHRETPESPASPGAPHVVPRWIPAAFIGWCVISLGVTEAWYRSHRAGEFVRWSVRWPSTEGNYEKIEIPEAALAQLKCDTHRAASWTAADGSNWMMFFLQWWPGRASGKILARMHRPEICLPASGIELVEDLGMTEIPISDVRLPARVYAFRRGNEPIYVFYALWEERPPGAPQPGVTEESMQLQRLRAVAEGRRNFGQQVIEIAVSGYSGAEQAREKVAARMRSLLEPERHQLGR